MKTIFAQAIVRLLHIFWNRDTLAMLKFGLHSVFVELVLVVLSHEGGL